MSIHNSNFLVLNAKMIHKSGCADISVCAELERRQLELSGVSFHAFIHGFSALVEALLSSYVCTLQERPQSRVFTLLSKKADSRAGM